MQKLPAFLILFLIYISEVFDQVKKQLPGVMSLLFVDNLEFIALRKSVKEISKILEKIRKIIFRYGEENVVTYNITKSKLILFFHTH